MDIGKWKMLAVSMTLICCLAVPVLAYTYIWRTPLYPLTAGIILRDPPAPTMALGFWWDSALTQPVTTIDFGEIVFSTGPVMLEKTIYISNDGSNATTIFWNSTLSATTTAITEEWVFPGMDPIPWNGTVLGYWMYTQTTYRIWIQPSPPTGTYNWTLTVWGECYL
jgi:hypothetical protein